MEVKRPSLSSGRTPSQRKEDAVKRKAVFLEAFGEWGTIRKGCDAAGIHRNTYLWWLGSDPDFARSVDLMKQSFAESLEAIALERVKDPDKNRGSDVLLLGLLNANLPTKFRPQFAMSEDSAKDLIIEWRKAARDRVREEKVREPEELPVSVERTLTELLEKRRDAPEKDE